MSFFTLYFHDATSAQERPQTPLDAVKHWRNKNNMIIYMQNIWNNTRNHWKGKTYLDAPSSSCGLLLWQQTLSYLRGKNIELLFRQWSVQRWAQKRIRPMREQQFKTEKRERGQARNVLTPPSELLDSTMVQTKVRYIHGNSKLKVP